jgi:integrase
MGRKGAGGVDEHNGALRVRFTLDKQRQSIILRLNSGAPMIPTAANMKHALRLAADVRQAIRTGTFSWDRFFPYDPRARDVAGTDTVGELLDRWVSSVRVEPSTLKSYLTAVAFWKSTPAGHKRASELVKSDILQALATRPMLKGKTVNNYLVALRQGLGLAVDDGRLATNVGKTIKSAKVQAPEPDPFTLEEAEAICEDMRKHYPEQVYWYVVAKFWTGLRSSESYALRWGDIDLRAGTMHVHAGVVLGIEKETTKTKQARTVMLNSLARQAITGMRPHTYMGGEHVFVDPARRAMGPRTVLHPVVLDTDHQAPGHPLPAALQHPALLRDPASHGRAPARLVRGPAWARREDVPQPLCPVDTQRRRRGRNGGLRERPEGQQAAPAGCLITSDSVPIWSQKCVFTWSGRRESNPTSPRGTSPVNFGFPS